MARIFIYDGREFEDPDPEMTVDQVKASLADFYGELANATVSETKRGEGTPSTYSTSGLGPKER